MVGSLRIWFTYCRLDWDRVEELGAVWPAGEDAALRCSGDLQLEVQESGRPPCSPIAYMRQPKLRGRPAEAGALIWISLLTTSSSLSH